MSRKLREVALTTWQQQLSLVRFEFAGEQRFAICITQHRDKAVA